jgi:transcriptional antiterminator RfaH
MNWYVIYTRSRYEKVVSEKLAASGVEVYCPMLKTRRRWSDRWKWVEEPLFRSYCFVRLNDENRDEVFNISGVVRYLYYCGKPAIVREKEIDLLKEWLQEYSHDAIKSVGYHVNDKVILRTGALMDHTAEVISSSGNYIMMKLESLGIQIKVDLRKNIVEKLAGC